MSDDKPAEVEAALDPAKATSAEPTVLEQLKYWIPTTSDVDVLSQLARETLDRVTALTEYEDGKAGRVLTAVALLSAAAGAIYSSMLGNILPALSWIHRTTFNCVFFSYVTVDAVSVFLLLSAIYPWFHIPKYWRRKKSPTEPPKSMIFGPLIAE